MFEVDARKDNTGLFWLSIVVLFLTMVCAVLAYVFSPDEPQPGSCVVVVGQTVQELCPDDYQEV
jgi:hypothetical protein